MAEVQFMNSIVDFLGNVMTDERLTEGADYDRTEIKQILLYV